ncbi:hypothetical protein FFF93_007530 [Arthrobacter sp. KBS0702]|nr:hypothetical protein FFF93_007530 [Arthrobacter sp. KBS0702]
MAFIAVPSRCVVGGPHARTAGTGCAITFGCSGRCRGTISDRATGWFGPCAGPWRCGLVVKVTDRHLTLGDTASASPTVVSATE